MNPFGQLALFFLSVNDKLIHAVNNFVLAVFLTDMIERRHVVDIVAAVEIVEALICGQVFAVIAEMPLAECARVVARRLESFGNGDFVAEHSVCVAAHFN